MEKTENVIKTTHDIDHNGIVIKEGTRGSIAKDYEDGYLFDISFPKHDNVVLTLKLNIDFVFV